MRARSFSAASCSASRRDGRRPPPGVGRGAEWVGDASDGLGSEIKPGEGLGVGAFGGGAPREGRKLTESNLVRDYGQGLGRAV